MVYLVRHKTDTGPVQADILIHNIYNVHDENIYYYAYYGPVNIFIVLLIICTLLCQQVYTLYSYSVMVYIDKELTHPKMHLSCLKNSMLNFERKLTITCVTRML